MKRIFSILLILVMVVSLSACSGGDNDDTQQNQILSPTEDNSLQNGDDIDVSQNESEPEETAEQGSNILVAYFSRVGNTDWEDGVDAVTSASINMENGEFVGNAEYLAKMVQEVTGGDLFLIETVDSYPSDYRQTTDQAKVEQNDDARPALASHVENMDQYDTIVLIYPNWWGTFPQPLFTFLEEYDFSGKTILPLCTHAGSRMGSSERDIAALCPDAALLDGLAVSGSGAVSARSDVEAWINDAGIFE